MQLRKTFVAVAVMAVAGAVSAAPSTINIVGANAGSTPMISADSGSTFQAVNSYEFIVTSTAPAGSFATFCLEPFQHLTTPWVYDNSGVFTVSQSSALSKLFTGAGWQSWNYAADSVTTDVQRAGLQLGVWEIFNDTSGLFNLTSGSFQVGNDAFSGAAIAFANTAYAAGNTSLAPYLIRLTDPVKQDLVIAVPEPTTYALMLAGLLSVGFVARRRRQD